MAFRCTQCGQPCKKTGESSTTFGEPPYPDHLCYKCEVHGYHVLDAQHNAIYGDSGRPDWQFDHIASSMNIEWKWLEP